MDTTDIDLIRGLVRAGSLSEASALLNQSQPTLSRKLSRLEDRLGAQLFHRSPKGLLPTDIAAYILSKAKPIDHQLREIERHVELTTQLDTGILNLGVGPIIEQILLPSVLSKFIETTGNAALSIATEDPETLMKMFKASELDLVVGPFSAQAIDDNEVTALPMVRDKLIAVARPEHPIFELQDLDETTLSQFCVAAPKSRGSATRVGSRLLPRPKIYSDNYDLLKKTTLRSDVLCTAPRSVFKDEIARGELREVNIAIQVTWESALIIRSETMLAPLARHLVQIFEDACREAAAYL